MSNKIRRTHSVWYNGSMYVVPEGFKLRARELWGQSGKGNRCGPTTYANMVRAFVLSAVNNGKFGSIKARIDKERFDWQETFPGVEFDFNNPSKGLVDWVIDWFAPDHNYSLPESFSPTEFDREWGEDTIITTLNWWDDIRSSAKHFESFFKVASKVSVPLERVA